MRVVYVGTHTSNLSHLVNLDQQRPQYLIYPHPEIHPTHPWKPEAAREVEANIRREVNYFPANYIRDNLIDSFFEKINPYFPVIDEDDFRARYVDLENKPPILLIDAVLLAGAHVSCHPEVAPERYAIKMAIFRRAKYLFSIRHENDRMNLVQAALPQPLTCPNTGQTPKASEKYSEVTWNSLRVRCPVCKKDTATTTRRLLQMK